MSFPSRVALAMSLVIALAACAGGPAATRPFESASVPTLAPEATDTETSAEPDETFVGNDLGNGRPVDISITIAGGSSSDGSYHATGVSRVCGNAMVNVTGNMRAFNFEFPYESVPEISNAGFSAEDLVAGSTTNTFHVDVSVRPKGGNPPPALVIDTTDSGPAGHSGSAQRSEANGTITLVVDAVGDLGATLRMTATCGPRPG